MGCEGVVVGNDVLGLETRLVRVLLVVGLVFDLRVRFLSVVFDLYPRNS